VLRPALPTLIEFASRRDPRLRFLAPFVGYYAAAKAIESIFAAAAGVSAYYFLKLRSWARAALEAASWVYLLYLCGFAYFSYPFWRRAVLDPSLAKSAQVLPELVSRAGRWVVRVIAGRI